LVTETDCPLCVYDPFHRLVMVWLPANVQVNVQLLIADEPVLLMVTLAPKPLPQSLVLVYVTEQVPPPEDDVAVGGIDVLVRVAVGGTDVFVRVAVGPMGVFVFVAVGPGGVLVRVAVGGTEVFVGGTDVLVGLVPPGSLPQTREPLT